MSFEIYAENAEIVGAFLSLATQWRVIVGFGGAMWQGLEYASIPVVLSALAIEDRAGAFAGLRIMEAAALRVLNEKHGG